MIIIIVPLRFDTVLVPVDIVPIRFDRAGRWYHMEEDVNARCTHSVFKTSNLPQLKGFIGGDSR